MRGNFGAFDDQALIVSISTEADTTGPNMIKTYKVFYRIEPIPEFFTLEHVKVTNATLLSVGKIDEGFFFAEITPLTDGEVSATITDLQLVSGYRLFSPVDVKFMIDGTPPTVILDQASSQRDPSSDSQILFTAVFSEKIKDSSLTDSDITNTGTASVSDWTFASTDNITWTITATVSSEGTVIPSFNAGQVEDPAGNGNIVSTTTADNSILMDFTLPTITIDQSIGQADPTSNTTVNFTAVFSEPMDASTFTADDIQNLGTAAISLWTITNIDATTWQVTAYVSSSGSVIPGFAANSIKDVAGNFNLASTSTDNSVMIDITGPSLTINQLPAQVDPTLASPILYIIVFSEPVEFSTFTSADITQTGTASITSWVLNTTDNITWFLTANVNSGGGSGTVIPVINAGAVTDIYNNLNFASTSTDNLVAYDITPPTVTINQKVGQADPTNVASADFTVTFSEVIDPITFDSADLIQTGTAIVSNWLFNTNDNMTWTITAIITSPGTVIPKIGSNMYKDVAGNNNTTSSTSTDDSVTYDNSSPSLTINQSGSQADPISALPISFTIVATEALSDVNFTTADITQNGTAAGITWNLTTSDKITWTLTATAITTPGTVMPTVGSGVMTDLAGNTNNAASFTDNSVLYDLTAPTVTINQIGGQIDPTNSLPISFNVVFSEAVEPLSFTNGDITQVGSAAGITWSLIDSGDHINWTLNATAITTPGTVIPTIAAAALKDVAGNNNMASTATDNSVKYDITPPTVTINQKATGQADPTNINTVQFTVVFSEAIDPASFTAVDLVQNGTSTVTGWALTTSDYITWTTTGTVSSPGTIVPTIGGNAVIDLAGNNNTASTSSDNSITYDNVAPTLTINQAGSQIDPINTLPITFTIVASEALTPADFTNLDITQNGTAAGITWVLTDSGDQINWTLAATAITTPGTVVPSIGSAKVTDRAGNLNSAGSTSTDNLVTYDLTQPTVTVNQGTAQLDPTNTLPITFRIVFSETINGASFSTADITQVGTATGITWNLTTSDNIIWTLSANAVSGPGTVVPQIAINKVTDAAGNNNLVSTSTDNNVLYDISAPTVTINQQGGQADPTKVSTIIFTIVFSEAIEPSSFTNLDIALDPSSTGAVSAWGLSTLNNITWTATATASADGTIKPIIAAGVANDNAGNNNLVSTSTDSTVTYDSTRPTLTANKALSQSDPTNINVMNFSFVFSEAIDPNSFAIGDILVSAGSGTITSSTLGSSDNINWTFSVTTATSPPTFTVTASLPANAVDDLSGNQSFASTSTDNSIYYDTTAVTVTLNQKAGQVDPTTNPTVNFTAVFSSALNPATFEGSDISQIGTATTGTWGLATLDNITWTLTTTASSEGSIIPTMGTGVVQNWASTYNSASASTDNIVVYDVTSPTLTINQKVGQADPTNNNTVIFTVVASEAINPVTFTGSDVTQSGTAIVSFWSVNSADNITWTVTATVSTPGTVIPVLSVSSVTDPAGNNNLVGTSTDNSVVYDNVAPTLTINQNGGQSDPINTLPISFTIVASEALDPATFTIADITQNGTAAGITWNLSDSGNHINYTLTATAITNPGTVVPSIITSRVTDVAGNNNTASTSTDNSVTYDITQPTVTINQGTGQLDPINALPITFKIVFSEEVTTASFTTADITQNGSATGITWGLTDSGDHINWTLTATAIGSPGTVIPTISANKVIDVAGNNNTASTSTDNSVTYDIAQPTVTINQKSGQLDPTNVNTVQFTIVFSEAINPSSFMPVDISQTGNATVSGWGLTTVDNITWTTTGTITSAGTVAPIISLNKVTDIAGNNNTASTSTDNTVVYDNVAPTLTVNQGTAQLDPINTLPITFKIVTSEPLNASSFTNADITQGGTAVGVTWSLSQIDGFNWTLTATAVTTPGTVIPSIAAVKVTDLAGNNNTASTSTDNSVLYDLTPPTVTVNQGTGQLDPINSLPISFKVVFSEAVATASFTTADITQAGTASGITWNLLDSGDQINWTLTATAITTPGTVVPTITANKVIDVAGNNNTASTSTDNSVIYDIAQPTVTINQKVGQADPTNINSVQFTVVFSELINPATFAGVDITQNGTATISGWAVTTADNITWTTTGTITSPGTVIPTITINKVADIAGNLNTASTSSDNSVTYDNVAPTLTINQSGGQPDPTSKVPVSFTIVASEALNPTTFFTTDITQSGTATGITWNLTTVNNITWTLTAISSGFGTIRPSIISGRVSDTAGNSNSAASTSTDNTVNYIQIFLNIADATTTEGSSATFAVTINSAHDQNVSFNYATSAITASGAGIDYTTTTGSSMIASGATFVNIVVPTTPDTLYENSETFNLTLSSVTVATVTDGTGLGTITSDDPIPTVAFTTFGQTISETTGANLAVVSISTLSGLNAVIPYSISGSSSSPADHNLTNGTLTIPAGISSGTINFVLVNDTAYEPSETLVITLGSPTSANLGAQFTHTVTITSEDPPPTMSIGNITMGEGDVAQFPVTLNAASSYNATAIYNTANGTALSGTHYTASTGTVTVLAGSLTAYINVPTIENAVNQNSAEWKFTTTLSSPVNATIAVTTGTGTIQDDDNPPGPFAINGVTGSGDITNDNFLIGSLYPTINWQTSPGADHYTVLIRNSGDTADVCTNQSTTSLFYTFSTCTLTYGTSYIAKVYAWRTSSLIASVTNPFAFTVKSTPPADFDITGVTSTNLDTLADHFLEDGTIPTFNWNTADSSSTYEITVYTSTGTTVACNLVTAPANTSSYTYSSCSLGPNQYYVSINAKDGLGNLTPATNSKYPFQLPTTGTFCYNGGTYDAGASGSPTVTSITNSYIGRLYDSGGPSGNYVKNEYCNVLVNPSGNNPVDLTFVSFTTKESADNMWLYDSTSASGAATGPFYGGTIPADYQAGSGATYLTWVSSVAKHESGWEIYYKSEPTIPGGFNITGITSSSDAVVDSWLQGTIAFATINWQASSTATSYEVWIEDAESLTPVCPKQTISVTSYSFATCILARGASYKAYVTAKDSWGVMQPALNTGFLFTYDPGPSAFGITGITGGTGDIVTNATLSDGYSPVVNFQDTTFETSFKLTLYNNDAGPSLKCSTVTIGADSSNYSWNTCTLDSYVTYRLKVEAVSQSGLVTTATNSLYNFYVSTPILPPGSFSITGVTGGADTTIDTTLASTFNPTINWATSARAATYDVGVYDSTNTTPICPTVSNITGNSYAFSSCSLVNGGTYKVRASATNVTSATTSSNNGTYSFVVNNVSTGSFLIGGITGGLDVTADTTLADGNISTATWGTSAGASNYEVEIFTSTGTTYACPGVFPISTTSTQLSISACPLVEDNVYSLKVTARDLVGNQKLATNSPYTFKMDSLPLLSLPSLNLVEGMGSGITVATLDHAVARDTTFIYYTSGGSPGVDYTAVTATTVTILAGLKSANLSIPLTDDIIEENTESFTVTIGSAFTGGISTPLSSGLSTLSTTTYIEDNDGDTWVIEKGDTDYTYSGAWGTQGISTATNTPSGRQDFAAFQVSGSTFFLFGGYGYDALNTSNVPLDDLWQFDTSNKQWTWLAGSSVSSGTVLTYGIYGTQAVEAASNWPGGRYGTSTAKDSNNMIWMFGGSGNSSNTTNSLLCDLWKFNPTNKRWTWVAGLNTTCTTGVYGTKSVGDVNNHPGGRLGSNMWTSTTSGTVFIWVFGGQTDSSTYYNDLWKFNTVNYQWTWVNGNNTVNSSGIYGSLNVESGTGTPGSRSYASYTKDGSGNLWMFAGYGRDSNKLLGRLNDLWKFNPTNGLWTWVSGSNLANQLNVFNRDRVTQPENMPSGNWGSSMWNSGNYLWINTSDIAETNNNYNRQLLWRYDINTRLWTYQKGATSTYAPNMNFIYSNYRRSLNKIGYRTFAPAWVDSNGEGWIFGGYSGYYSSTGGSGCCYLTKSLWHFKPDTVRRLTVADNSGIEGTTMLGYASLNYPIATNATFSWTTANNTAASGSDYATNLGNNVILTAGSAYYLMTASILADGLPESPQSFYMNITAATGIDYLNDNSGSMSILDNDAYRVVVRGSTQLTAGSCSQAYFLEVQNSVGATTPLAGGDTIGLSVGTATPTGIFYTEPTCTTTGSLATITSGGKFSNNFYFKDTKAETVTFTADPQTNINLLTTTFNVSVSSLGSASRLAVSGLNSIMAGSCYMYIVSSRDNSGIPAKLPTAGTINLSFENQNLKAYGNSTCSAPVTTATIAANSSFASFYVTATTVDSEKYLRVFHATYGNALLPISVYSSTSVVNNPNHIIASGPLSVTAGSCARYEGGVYTKDKNLYRGSGSYNINLAASTGTYYNGAKMVCSNAVSSVNSVANIGTFSTNFQSNYIGYDLLVFAYASLKNTTLPITITKNATNKLSWAGDSSIANTTCGTYTITVRDGSENPVNLGSNLTVNLTAFNGASSYPGLFYSDNACSAGITSTTIASGTNNKVVYFKSSASSGTRYLAAISTGYDSAAYRVFVNPGGNRISISMGTTTLVTTATIPRNNCSQFTVNYLNSAGAPTNIGSAEYINFDGAGFGEFYSDVSCASPITQLYFSSGNSMAFYYKSPVANADVTIRAMLSSSLIEQKAQIRTSMLTDADRIIITGANAQAVNACKPIRFALAAPDNQDALYASTVTVNLTGGSLSSDSGCTLGVTSTTITTGTNAKTLYFKDTTQQVVQIIGSDNGAVLKSGSLMVDVSYPTTQISTGYTHSCSIRNGAAYCWGSNTNGELGDGTNVSKYKPNLVPGLTSGVTAIAAGNHYSCAVHNGAVKCWGINTYGQLGDGTYTERRSPTQVSGLTTGATSVKINRGSSTSVYVTCAIVSNALKCWGQNSSSMLANTGVATYTALPVTSGSFTNVTQVDIGVNNVCAVESGTAYCWGNNSYYTNGNQTSAGYQTTPYAIPAATAGTGVTKVSTGQYNSCAISAGGKLNCWGYNRYGAVAGDGSSILSYITAGTTSMYMTSGVTDVQMANNHLCAIKDSGAYCWGYAATYSQTGIGYSTTYMPTFVQGLTQGVTSVAVNSMHSCAITYGNLSCWGNNTYMQLSIPQYPLQTSPIVLNNFPGLAKKVSTGGAHTCATTTTDTAYCWGANSYGQLGNGLITDTPEPVAVTGIPGTVSAIDSGNYFNCALNSSNTVYCWGYGFDGELGNGTAVPIYTPVPVSGGTGVSAIAVGGYHACAIQNGGLFCWGGNSNGQLGNDSFTQANTPVPVVGMSTGVTAVVTGLSTTCALQSGAVKCWGSNSNFPVGYNVNFANVQVPYSLPTPLNSGVTALYGGGNFFCALASTGVYYCWGSGYNGEFASGTTGAYYIPQLMPFNSLVSQMSVGDTNVCIIDAGRLYCWGYNNYGQTGYGGLNPNVYYMTPVQYLGTVLQVASGSSHTCAIDSNNKIYCWGNNNSGQTGYYSTSSPSGASVSIYPQTVVY
jgi:alpha-tubulin suppressor-like RCC1 family protein